MLFFPNMSSLIPLGTEKNRLLRGGSAEQPLHLGPNCKEGRAPGHTLISLLPVSLKNNSRDSTLVTVSTVEYAAALPKQSRMTSV